jgi:hypothetical protein
MSEQRIDTGADAATSTDADPGEGLGVAGPSADPRGAAGGDAEMPQPTADRPGGGGAAGSGGTEGESYVRDTEAHQRGEADLDGREPAGDGGTSRPAGEPRRRPTGPDGDFRPSADATRPRADAEPGEVTAEPSQRRREQDPGSVSEEFADRAGTAPDDDIAHPSI